LALLLSVRFNAMTSPFHTGGAGAVPNFFGYRSEPRRASR
jgi:hypothetical protein